LKTTKYDYVIVGSGAGGATLACEISRRDNNKKVLLIEKGKYQNKLGKLRHIFNYYDFPRGMPLRSKEGVIIWRAFMAGGSTVISAGNGGRCLEKELADFGINLEEEFIETEKDMRLAPIDRSLLSERSEKIMRAAKETGPGMQLMPKFIDPKKCRKCGNCFMGCPYGAKWSALSYLHRAKKNGVEIAYETTIEKVQTRNGKATGVIGIGPHGRQEILADAVIIAAGGLSTPVILQNSGIKDAGSNLFVDPLINIYGLTAEMKQDDEPTMALLEVHRDKGFILSSHITRDKAARFIECGTKKPVFAAASKVLGMMAKIHDDAGGRVFPDGSISMPITKNDQERFERAFSRAEEILVNAGVKKKSIVRSKICGAHPGGTAGIGSIVDKDLQTGIDNLFVCDASVLPESPGLPPIETIVALAKRLGKFLAA
jgi:choline dehydrogenase-like flavoprotein